MTLRNKTLSKLGGGASGKSWRLSLVASEWINALIIFTLISCMKSALICALDAGVTIATFMGCRIQADPQFFSRQNLEYCEAFNLVARAAATLIDGGAGTKKCSSRDIACSGCW